MVLVDTCYALGQHVLTMQCSHVYTRGMYVCKPITYKQTNVQMLSHETGVICLLSADKECIHMHTHV